MGGEMPPDLEYLIFGESMWVLANGRAEQKSGVILL
jgi:hypothetical protein